MHSYHQMLLNVTCQALQYSVLFSAAIQLASVLTEWWISSFAQRVRLSHQWRPPVFQFVKYLDLFIKLSCIARASRLALSPSRLLSQWMNNCDFSLCLYDAEPHGEEQHNRPALNRLCMKTNCGSLQPREQQRAEDRSLPPQKNKQQKFAKCPHAMGRSKLQVMDFEGAEMFIRRDEQNHGGGMRGSCRMCHVARKKC